MAVRYALLVAAMAFAATPLLAQSPSGTLSATASGFAPASGPGSPNAAVAGGPAPIDPTKNVLDLVREAVTRLNDVISLILKGQEALRTADEKYQNAMREAEIRRFNDLREADNRIGKELREAETRRINELAAQKQVFDLELARVIRANVDASTLLLAGQVRELKADSSDRTAKLEVFANEQRGRSSALDPANTRLLEEVSVLRQQRANTSGQSEGAQWLWALIAGVLGLIFGAIVAGAAVMRARHPT